VRRVSTPVGRPGFAGRPAMMSRPMPIPGSIQTLADCEVARGTALPRRTDAKGVSIPQDPRPEGPILHLPVTFTDGSLTEKLNKTGVRLWTEVFLAGFTSWVRLCR
jgi:hypothetical protein